MLWFIIFLLSLLVFLLLALVKLYFVFTKISFKSDVDLTGKVVLITGGNTGIGKEYVRDIARRNCKIIMACRNVERGLKCANEISNETHNSQIFVERCDLTSFQSVRTFCELIRSRESKIDVLMCFAAAVGYNTENVKHRFTEDGLEKQFQGNYLSHFLMIHMLMDLLRKSPQARIILTSSSAHLMAKIELDNISRMERYEKSAFMTYADSKLALVMLGKELANRLVNTPAITVNSFHPGTVYTNGIKHLTVPHLKLFLRTVAFFYSKTSKDAAQDMLYLTLSNEVANISGCYFGDCTRATTNRLVDDAQLRKDLWDLSVTLIRPWLGEIKPIST